MITIKRRPLPDHPDYIAACEQTNTLYNTYGPSNAKQYHRTVFVESSFLDDERDTQITSTGMIATSNAKFIVPQGANGYTYVPFDKFDALDDKTGYFTVRSGDKVMRGVGPEITTSKEWGDFISSKNPYIVQLKNVFHGHTKKGELVQIEATT